MKTSRRKAVPVSFAPVPNEVIKMDINDFSYMKETDTLIAELSDTDVRHYREQTVHVHNPKTGVTKRFYFHYCDFTPSGDIAGYNLNCGSCDTTVLLIND